MKIRVTAKWELLQIVYEDAPKDWGVEVFGPWLVDLVIEFCQMMEELTSHLN